MRQLKALGLVEEFSNSVLIGLYGVESEDDRKSSIFHFHSTVSFNDFHSNVLSFAVECSIDFLAVSGVDPSKRQEALVSSIELDGSQFCINPSSNSST